MNFIISYFVPFAGSLFIILFLFYCMSKLGVMEYPSLKIKVLLISSYSLFCTVMAFLGNGILNLLFICLIPILGYFLLQKSKTYVLLYYALCAGLYLCDAIISLALTFLTSKNELVFLHPSLQYLFDVVTIRFVEFIFLHALTSFMKKRMRGSLSWKQFLSIFIFPAFSILNMMTLILFLDVFPTTEHEVLFFMNIIFLLFLNLYFVSIVQTMTRNHYLENELFLQQQQQELQNTYYKSLEQKYDRTRNLRHDMRNHIQSIQRLYLSKDLPFSLKDASPGDAYILDLQTILNELSMHYYTQNKMLNIILNEKANQMLPLGIDTDFTIADVSFDFMRDIDITTIFANILDNALDSALLAKEHFVTLDIRQNYNIISITLKNSMKQKPDLHQGRLISLKPSHHGLGLKNVEQIIKQYNGDIQYEWSDTYFITRIMLDP